MAGAKPGVHALQLKPHSVHEELKKGGKFVRFEEEPSSYAPILGTLKVDLSGFFLCWSGSGSETEIYDISTIRDTRTGKYAKQSKDPMVRTYSIHNLLTIVYGQDLVNVRYLCFAAAVVETAQIWTSELSLLATNILSQNASRNTYLLKAFTKLKLQISPDGKIPLKCFVKMFSDKRRVETALETCGLLNNKSDGVKMEDLTQECFFKFIDCMCLRTELQTILEKCGAKRKPFITLEQFEDFINCKQRDSRLNEVLYPPLKQDQIRQIMEKFETNTSQLERDQISLQAFSRYLGSDENCIVPPERLDLIDDMSQPLAHYFINSSHNTYLTVGQLTGLSSVEMYRQVLLTGCRCIELDCWKGRPPEEEPYITHGFTMTTEISFKEVIEAIAESAFKASPYPLILSFENHVDSAKQQAKMAEYCRTIFGDALLIEPLEKYPLVPGQPLPSPQDLIGKILIKNKKRHTVEKATIRRKETGEPTSPSYEKDTERESQQPLSNGEKKPYQRSIREPGRPIGEGDSEEEEEEENVAEPKKPTSDEGTAGTEAVATEEMSNLVNYVEPVKFKSFEVAAKRKKYFEMSSFVETKAMDALKNYPIEFVEYNKNQMSRIYPKGTRVDSSNYMPQLYWNVGCQMVALNFQTLDLPMQLNMGVFEYNGHSGYLLKPEFMRRPDKHFDPFTEGIVDGIVANTITIKVISGQFLSEKKVGVYVEVDLFGLPADTKRKFRTKTSNGNSMDPVWDEDEFIFYKVILPTLASLRIVVLEENGKFIGHRILPVSAIRPGYHYINLKNELNQPLYLPSLLVYTDAKDYVPNEHIEYADALTNPIKHLNQLAKRETQLSCLLENNSEVGEDRKDSEIISTDSVSSPQQPLAPSPVEESSDIPKVPAPVVVQTPKEDLVTTVITEISSLSLSVEELKGQKSYTKLVKKQAKDLHDLHKKNHKKIQSETQKRRNILEKTFKRSLKKSDSQDGTPRDLEKQKQKLQMWEQQRQELLALRQEHYAQEKQMQQQHLEEACEKLKQMANECHNSQMKKHKDISEKEKKELQKILERKRINSITEAKTKDKDKELDPNEINRKHISECVETIRRLEKAQSMREEKITLRYQEMLQQMTNQFSQLQSQLDQTVREDYSPLPDEINRHLHLDLQIKGAANDSPFSGLSNCSSPDSLSNSPAPFFQSMPFLRPLLKKSMDNSQVSKSESTSSPTSPGLSEAEISFN